MGIHTYFKNLTNLERMYRCPGNFVFERHNVASHSFKVAQYAQFLGEVEANSGTEIDWKVLYEKAINHDFPEVFIGDIKTPVKYASPELRELIGKVEEGMVESFVKTEIPTEFQDSYIAKLKEGKDGTVEGLILAVADKLDQVYESFDEIQRGNADPSFPMMYKNALKAIVKIDLHCVRYFVDVILQDMLNEELNSSVNIREITNEALNE